jgi:phosphate transport system permease protein
MSTELDAQRDEAAAVEAPATRGVSVAVIVGAACAGIGAGILVHASLGVAGIVIPAIVGFVAYVAIVGVAEFARARAANAPAVVDLTAEDPAPSVPPPAVYAVTDPETIEPAPAEEGPESDVPRQRRAIGVDDLVEFGVAAVTAAGVAELLRVFLHMQSTLGFVFWWYAAFVVFYYLLTRDRSDSESGLDRVVTVVVWSAAVAVAGVLTWMVIFVFAKGIGRLTWAFLTHDMRKTGPLSPGGGVYHAIWGTFLQVGIAALIVVPVGIMTAVYLHEVNGRMAAPIRFVVDAMAGLPSIVAGLFVFTIFVSSHGYSGAAAAAALAVLMLPTMTRTAEEILRTVPNGLREGALALGAPQWRLVQRVVLPTALAGLMTAALLAIARAVGETAPMLLTAFGADNTNKNVAKGPQDDLPLYVWKLIREPYATQWQRAWTGALILVLMIFIVFTAARMIAARGQKRLRGAR